MVDQKHIHYIRQHLQLILCSDDRDRIIKSISEINRVLREEEKRNGNTDKNGRHDAGCQSKG